MGSRVTRGRGEVVTVNIFSADMRRNPYPWYEAMRTGAPVLHVPGADLWLLFAYDDVKRALYEPEAFSSNVSPSRGVSFEWLLFMDPPRHTKLRALIMSAFTPRSIAGLEPRIRALSREILDRVIDRGEMDMVADFAVPLPMMVIAEMVGIPVVDWPQLKRWSDAIMGLGNTILGSQEASTEASQVFLAANAEMKDYLDRLVAERRAAPGDDLLTRLVEAEVGGERLSEQELLRFVQLLLAAGAETTTNLIDNAILCFAESPDELARLRSKPALLSSAIEEVLRYRSPAQAVFRATRRDVEIHGHTIPAGKLVLLMLGSANRDPKVFRDPDRFDITRDPNPHIAFGHGIHFCLGASLSRLEANVALSDFLSRVKRFALASDAPWEPRGTFHVHGPTHLPIRVEPIAGSARASAPSIAV